MTANIIDFTLARAVKKLKDIRYAIKAIQHRHTYIPPPVKVYSKKDRMINSCRAAIDSARPFVNYNKDK